MDEDKEKTKVLLKVKSVSGCCGSDYDDWMTRKDEYLNDLIDLTTGGIRTLQYKKLTVVERG